MQPFETIKVNTLEVQCDGGKTNPALGHPRVFLHIDRDKGKITCPYCSRQYAVGASTVKHASGH